MGAAELQQWYEEHGGQARDPVTDANGVTIHVAGDGSYISVTKDGTVRVRGFSPPAGGTVAPASGQASAPPAAAAADTTGADSTDASAPATGPLATYTQEQVNARLAEIAQQIGQQPRYVPQQHPRRVPNPAAVATSPNFDVNAPQYIDQPYTTESWYDPRTNTLLFQGQRQADGTFQTTTDAAPRQTATQVTAANTPARPPETHDEGGRRYVWQANPGGATAGGQWVDVGPAPLTTAEQQAKQAQQTTTKKTPLDGHPGVNLVTTANPQTGQIEAHYETDAGQRVDQPKDIKPGLVIKGAGVNGADAQAIADPTTGVIHYEPISGAQVPAENRPIPSGAPVFKPDYTQDDLGLQAYNEQLLAAQRANVIDAEQGRRLVAQASALAQTVTAHGTTLRSQAATTRGQDITQRGQDINEAESRRSFQGTGFDTSLREIGSNAKYLGAGHGGLAADAFLEALNLRPRYAAGAGGFANVPQVAGPSDAVTGTQVHIGADGNVAISPPGSVPPNAIGAGAIGNVPAPGGAPDQAAIAQHQADIQANPVFRPPPPISGATVAPAFVDRAPAPGSPPFSIPPGQVDLPGPTQLDPMSQPVGMSGQLPSYLQSVMPPVWQPHGVLGQLRGQGYTDDELQQAMQMAGVG